MPSGSPARAAVRRLRAILSAFAPVLPDEQRRWVSQELRWFGDVLGEARNLDVFNTDLIASGREALPFVSELERLSRAAQRRRKATQATVVKAISSTRYTEALLALLRWFDGGDWHLAAAPALHEPIETLAPVLLDRCRAKAEKRAKHFSYQSAKKRHRLRIALKKLRYAAELFAPLYAPAETKHFTHRLKRLQDDLGAANDVRVGRDIVESLAGPGRRAIGMVHAGKRLIKWHKRRIKKNEPQMREHLDGLLAAEPFWRG